MTIAHREVYPTQPKPLTAKIDALLRGAQPPEIDGQLVALIVPDSNRIKGGPVAADAFSLLRGKHYETVLLISPSHSGPFHRLTICETLEYHTPIGMVRVNDRVRHELCDEDDDIFLDDSGHYHTEGAQVQVPFLQRTLEGEFDIVPIVMGEESPVFCRELGHAVGEIMYGHQMLLVATADLLEIGEDAWERFEQALADYDESELMHLLGSEQVRVEGMGAVITALIAAKQRGANRAAVVRMTEPEGSEIGALACVLWRER